MKKTPARKPRTWVKTFIPDMARKVEAGTKRQTVRPWPERVQDIPRAGHRISCREWTGRPYNSKQRELCRGDIIEVHKIEIRRGSIFLDNDDSSITFTAPQRMTEFAKADGFESLHDFHAWFLKKRVSKFVGVLIMWRPDATTSGIA